MAAQVDLFCVDSFPSHLSLLDVFLSGPHFASLFQHETGPPTVLFTPQRPHGSGSPGILLHVHSVTEDEISRFGAESGSQIRLFTSRFFMRHHGFQHLASTGTVRVMEPFSLDRVVLGARSRQSLRWASAGQFTSGLLELCRTGLWLLVRRGDPLLLPRHPLLGEDPGQVRPGAESYQ